MKKIITILLVLSAIFIYGQNTSSNKFQKQFKKLENFEKINDFITSQDYIEVKENIEITHIYDIKVDIKSYYNAEKKEKLYIVLCKEYENDYFFVGGMINEVLDKDKQVALDFSYTHEYYSYLNKGNYISYLIKDNE